MNNKNFGLMIAAYIVAASIAVSTFVIATSSLAIYCW